MQTSVHVYLLSLINQPTEFFDNSRSIGWIEQEKNTKKFETLPGIEPKSFA